MLVREIVHNIYVGTTLVSMYTKCASAADARMVFDEMPSRNVFSWNAMIAGFAISGFCNEALVVYNQMKQAGTQPDNFTFPCVFKACAALGDLQQGRENHGYVIRSGFEFDVFVRSSLVDMYAKCGNLEDAHQVFDKMSQRDLVSWNVMISSYAQNGICDEALQLFRDMGVAGVMPDSATVVSVLPACAGLEALQQGKEIHHYAIKFRFEFDVDVGNALLTMYSKCGRVDDAERVFHKMSERDVVSWNAMIAGYAQNGFFEEAMKFFHQMQQASVKPNRVTIVTILHVCGQLVDLQQGKMIHDCIVGSEFESDVSIGNALIDMYAKCYSIENAHNLFDMMIKKDVVSWNAMISGYVLNERFVEALRLFHQMGLAGIKPDWVTVVSALCSCARLATLHQGKEVHNYIKRNGFESDVSFVNALIDMYAKCGSLENARQLFDRMLRRDLVSWTVMILGYGMHGRGEKALALFYQMQQEGMKPDHITFIAVLIACRHSGMVDEGWRCFNQMRHFNITPSVEHYACVVDLLGRSGHLDEAHRFIKNMPLQPNAEVWGALLGACRIHCNIELAEHVAKHLLELAPEHTGYYVLLSNIYSAASRWDGVAKVRVLMKGRRLKKNPGCSWIEVNNVVHSFVVGGRSHPQSEKIFAMLESLAKHMKLAGYVPNTNLVLPDMELEE
jgi:pentatricopeptide repeat protein